MTDSEKKIISRFVIDGLQDLCFAGLRGTYYGRCSGSSSFDCDNTRLANAIYVLLWGGEGNIFPELTMENVGTGKDFRGDTMNSFRWVLRSNKEPTVTPDKKIVDWVEKNAAYSKDKEDLIRTISHWKEYDKEKKVMAFYRKYHTIGNFVVLPNRKAGNTTMNLYRGKKRWQDFFDRFLIELDKVLSCQSDMDANLNDLVQCNRDAFRSRQLPELADALFLSDYMDGGKTKLLFKPPEKNIDDEEYRSFAMRYIDTATEIISRRAERMCEKLSELL